GEEKVLDVGTGSGYQAAILARLARDVISIERLPGLAARARSLLAALGVANVRVVEGDGSLGWPSEAPFDGICVAAAAPEPPAALVQQLAEGGRLVVPVGFGPVQDLVLVQRTQGEVRRSVLCESVFVPLIGKGGFPGEG
ncbi:MAG: methyltransferase domain-containing protein, partial [Planctomycetales bacterium]|nr:methyltransferase domain-containing protein [Planctomycetales bacterium]